MGELLHKQGLNQDATSKLVTVARTYSIRGEPHRAVEIYRRIIEYAPMDLNARSRLIEHLIAENDLEAALQEYFEWRLYYNWMIWNGAKPIRGASPTTNQDGSSFRVRSYIVWQILTQSRIGGSHCLSMSKFVPSNPAMNVSL